MCHNAPFLRTPPSPPKFCITIADCNTLEKLDTMVMQNFWGPLPSPLRKASYSGYVAYLLHRHHHPLPCSNIFVSFCTFHIPMIEENISQIHVRNPLSFSHNKVHCYLKKTKESMKELTDSST